MKSRELFSQGCNCAQSVFLPFAIKHNLDEKTALRLMSPFGGGISSTDNVCGALTGAIAAIGLHYGHSEAEDLETKNKCAKITQELIKEFENELGNTQCTQLIGYDLSQPGEREKAKKAGVFNNKCSQYVECSQAIVEKIVEKY